MQRKITVSKIERYDKVGPRTENVQFLAQDTTGQESRFYSLLPKAHQLIQEGRTFNVIASWDDKVSRYKVTWIYDNLQGKPGSAKSAPAKNGAGENLEPGYSTPDWISEHKKEVAFQGIIRLMVAGLIPPDDKLSITALDWAREQFGLAIQEVLVTKEHGNV